MNEYIAYCGLDCEAWILENNTCVERLYHRMGFQKTGRRNYIAHGLDEIEMHLTGTFLQVTG